MKTQDDIFALCDQIRETSFSLHRDLRHEHLEKVYENGLALRLRKTGPTLEQQYPLHVLDEDGTVLGDYLTDLTLFVDTGLHPGEMWRDIPSYCSKRRC